MKKIAWIVGFAFCLATGHSRAQKVDYNAIIKPNSASQLEFEEKLVRLAWNNDPESEGIRRYVDVAQQNHNIAAIDWLNIISLQGNLNEFNINSDRDVFGRSAFFPRYNVGARINLGQLFTIPFNTQRSRQEVLIAEAAVNDRKLALRTLVLKLYNNLLMQEKIYRLQSQLTLDVENAHNLAELRFKNGEITFDEYTVTRSSYNQAQISLFTAETAYKNAKLDLEELIGVRLEEVR